MRLVLLMWLLMAPFFLAIGVVQLSIAAQHLRGRVDTILKMLGVWADTWPDEQVRTRLLVVLRDGQSIKSRSKPREPEVMGLDFGIGRFIVRLVALARR